MNKLGGIFIISSPLTNRKKLTGFCGPFYFYTELIKNEM